jgi:hypothetical protein
MTKNLSRTLKPLVEYDDRNFAYPRSRCGNDSVSDHRIKSENLLFLHKIWTDMLRVPALKRKLINSKPTYAMRAINCFFFSLINSNALHSCKVRVLFFFFFVRMNETEMQFDERKRKQCYVMLVLSSNVRLSCVSIGFLKSNVVAFNTKPSKK